MSKKLVSIGKISKLFGVSGETIRRWSELGKIKCVKTLGGHRRYDLEEVKKLLENSNDQV